MADADSLIGAQIDNFYIHRLLGVGGMASVYLSTDLALQRDVVIKVLRSSLAENDELRLRFQREAQATAKLHHPNIVQVYTTGTLPDGKAYIALQYVEGGSLSDHLGELSRQGRWISTLYALSIARQMAGALQAAHQVNIIHRDLKPSNILLRKDGTAVLADLGIAAVQQATMRLTQTGGIIGTPNYMSPEQASSQLIDGRSDIYSLGVILYELLSGRLPFDADSPWAILHQHIYEQPTPLAQVRPDLTAQTLGVVDKCLRKQPDARFASAQELLAALEQAIVAENGNPLVTLGSADETVLEPLPVPAAGPTAATPVASGNLAGQTQKRPWWHYGLPLVLLLLLCIGAAGIWQVFGPGNNGKDEVDVQSTVVIVADDLSPEPIFTVQPTSNPTEPADDVTTTPPPPATLPGESGTIIEAVIDATSAVNDTGIYVKLGQQVSIQYQDGQWRAGPEPSWSLVGPGGDPQVPAKETFPVVDAPLAGLIGGIGDAPAIFVGEGTSFVAENEGTLWLAANDDGYEDNTGTLRVRIQLGAVPPETTAVPVVTQGVVAYSCGSGDQNQIFLYDLDRSEQTLLPNQPANSVVPAFSRDGRQIAYRSNESGTWQIYVSGVDGSSRRQITSGSGNNYEASWSPDGRQMTFVSDRSGSKQIFVMNNDGTDQRQLTFNANYNDDPTWSVADRIAYESDQDGRFNIYELPPEGGSPLLLFDIGASSSTPAWSPDGDTIAFESRSGDSRHIWIAERAGNDLQRLTDDGESNERPAWSPDGRRIAFHSNRQQGTGAFDIWLIDVETKELQRLTSRGDCYDPAWGPSAVAQPVPPPVRDGVSACALTTGATVSAGPNTRLWSVPDVSSGVRLESIVSGTLLQVTSGPEWGPITSSADGWWWQVETMDGAATGWAWQARLDECVN